MPKGTGKGILDGVSLPIVDGKKKDTINMTIPIIISTMTMCNICDKSIADEEALWRCEVFCDFDLCAKCYEKEGNANHPHKLLSVPIKDREGHNVGLATVTEMKDMLNLMRHGSRCQVQDCQFPRCRRVKWVFNHGRTCPVQSNGGCNMCKKIMHILHLHASACGESDCHVPHCKEMREETQRLIQGIDQAGSSNRTRKLSRRERMKQRVEEASKSSRKEIKKPHHEPSPQEKAIISGFWLLTLGAMLNKQREEKKPVLLNKQKGENK